MRTTAILGSLFFAASCASGPDFASPDIAPLTPASFADAGSAAAPADWWRQFDDPVLTKLIEDAFAANRDLETAAATVRKARAALGERRFDLAPTVTAAGSYSRSRQSAAGLGATIPGIPDEQPFDDTNRFDAAANASWELDFWARVRRSVEAARAEADVAAADYRSALVVISADVASAYVSLRGAERRLDVAKKNAALQQETLELTQSLMDAGRATDFDALRASAQLEATRANIPELEAAIAEQSRRIAVLTGRQPDALHAILESGGGIPAVPDSTPAGDPADILRQRPDIRSAEMRLAAATARIGVAAADLFPQVSFAGSFGASATDLASFGGAPSLGFGFGPAISWAAFDLGRVRARIRQADAEADAALSRYEQTVLLALEETANAFTGFAKARERAVRLQRAADDSALASELARARYEGGIESFLTVLDAERTRLAAEDQEAASDTEVMLNLVAIYRSIGGAWKAV